MTAIDHNQLRKVGFVAFAQPRRIETVLALFCCSMVLQWREESKFRWAQ